MSDKNKNAEKKTGWLSGVFAFFGSLTKSSKKLITSYSFDRQAPGTLTITSVYEIEKKDVTLETATWLEAQKLEGMADLYKIIRKRSKTYKKTKGELEVTPEIIDGKKALTFDEVLAAFKDFDDKAISGDEFEGISAPQKHNIKYHWSQHQKTPTPTSAQKPTPKKSADSALERLKTTAPRPKKN